MGQVEVIQGIERRRRWSEPEKQALVEKAFSGGGSVAAVCREAGIFGSQIYKWKRDFEAAAAGFAEVTVAPTRHEQQERIEVSIDQRIVASIPTSANPELVSVVLKSLVRR